MKPKNKNPMLQTSGAFHSIKNNIDTNGFTKSYPASPHKRRKYKRNFDRTLLPTPAKYYSKQFEKFKIKSEWVKVRCCFHDDHTPSLNISMISGGFRCFGCNARGGDIIAFHVQRYQMKFIDVVTHFGAWSHK
jgi:hypothetical protein